MYKRKKVTRPALIVGRDPEGRKRVVCDSMEKAKAEAAEYVKDFPATRPLSAWVFREEV